MQLRNKQAQQVFKFKLKRKLLLVMSLLTLWTPLSLVQAQMTIDKNESAMQSVGQSSESSQEGPTVRVRAIGDILLHDFVYERARTANGYNFDSMLAPVKSYLENADITVANMETIVAGESVGLGTYPFFNAPSQIVDSLKNVGVDIVNNVSNHTMDMGAQGVLASIKALKQRDMMYVGSYESWEDYNTPRIIERNGIKVGFLAYAYGLNGLERPQNQQYLATLIDKQLIPLEIKDLNSKVDVSVVIIQNGEEYETMPTADQIATHQMARDAGANFVLGGHPHVLEPFIYYNESQAGLFSHGNFLTGQYETATKVGGITEFTYRKLNDGKVILDSMRFMPTYNIGLPESNEYLVVPLADWQKYNIANGQALMDEIRQRMTRFTNKVQVVDYLD